ncbi:hypothetical protein pb186bvf_018587 [Paramecium bursaria]
MSMGWLTESALIPKPAVPINVDNSSIMDMKMALMKAKQKEQFGISKAKTNKKEKKVNKGIEERIKKDKADIVEDQEQNKLNKSAFILQKKADIYDKQKQIGINSKNSLIDFELKQLDTMDEKQKEEYEIQKQKFYKEKKIENQKLQQELMRNRPQIANPVMGFDHQQKQMERIQWEEKMLKEIESDMKESNAILNDKNIIEQSYDKRLTAAEKEKLPNVLIEEQEAKDKLIEVNKRRKELYDLRMEKLKKIVKK